MCNDAKMFLIKISLSCTLLSAIGVHNSIDLSAVSVTTFPVTGQTALGSQNQIMIVFLEKFLTSHVVEVGTNKQISAHSAASIVLYRCNR